MASAQDKPLVIAGKPLTSRLLLGTGKYANPEQAQQALAESGAEMITVSVRRCNIGQDNSQPNMLDILPPESIALPNTAGCYTCEDAVRTAQLARELLDGAPFIKLEVLGDEETLFPDVPATMEAAEILIKDDFAVMVYTNDDPIAALAFEKMGCAAVMPLAAPIGSGLGIRDPYNILTIVKNLSVPVIVDAGVGTASDAAIAMELGCDAVLMNTAIAEAQDPVLMARAMRNAVVAGRQAYLAGRMTKRDLASPSSPTQGLAE